MPIAEKENEAAFVRVRQPAVQPAVYEAFHAYLNTSFYPATGRHYPALWLTRGDRRRIFETAIVEVGELRGWHADADAAWAGRGGDEDGNLLPLADRCAPPRATAPPSVAASKKGHALYQKGLGPAIKSRVWRCVPI